MIRPAREEDLPRILAMCETFHGYTYNPHIVAFDPEVFINLIRTLESKHVSLVVEEDGKVVGMAGAILAPHIFGPYVTVAHEVWLWIESEYRGGGLAKELLAALEAACKERGAEFMIMVCLANGSLSVATMYIKSGYDHIEMTFAKRI